MLIEKLKGESKVFAQREYNDKKYSKTNAYLCWFIGCYRIYKGEIGLFILQLLSYTIVIGWIRWLVDAFMVSSYVKNKNELLDQEIYVKYK